MTESESRAQVSALEARVKELEEERRLVFEALTHEFLPSEIINRVTAFVLANRSINPPAKEAENG